MPDVIPNRARKARLLCFSKCAVLYSILAKMPVWSAEHVTSERIEAAAGVPRTNAFHSLAPNERAELADYQDSGFDRGHMAPAGDMSTAKAKGESFLLAT
jgi:endonuclease G, mitochondrial